MLLPVSFLKPILVIKPTLNNFTVTAIRIMDIEAPAFTTANGLKGPICYFTTGGGTDQNLVISNADFQTDLTYALSELADSGAGGVVINAPPIVLTSSLGLYGRIKFH